MNKTITKNLIYLAIGLMLMPASVVMAEDRIPEKESEVVVSQVLVKPQITLENNVSQIRNIIDEAKIKNSVNQNTKPLNNSQDWSQSKYTKEEIMNKICQVFVNNCQEALIIARMESGYRPWAISRTNDWGVFQLNCRWQGRRVGGNCNKFLDVDTNIRIAKQIYNEQGWNPWTTKKFLKQ